MTCPRDAINKKPGAAKDADTGPGIPTEQQQHIFVPFFTTKQKGTGLGLAISQRIVKNHGGTLAVRSKPGEGATFVIRLPAPLSEPVPEPVAEPTASPEAGLAEGLKPTEALSAEDAPRPPRPERKSRRDKKRRAG